MASRHRALKNYFRAPVSPMKRWPKRKHLSRRRNIVLSLLTGDKGTLSGLSLRSGLSIQHCGFILNGLCHPSAENAQRLARGLGVSTDTFIDVLRVYVWEPREAQKKRVKEVVQDSKTPA